MMKSALFQGSPKYVMLLPARGGGQSTAAFSSPITKAMGSSYVLYLAHLHFASIEHYMFRTTLFRVQSSGERTLHNLIILSLERGVQGKRVFLEFLNI